MSVNAKHLEELSRIIAQNIASRTPQDATPAVVEVSKESSERLESLRKEFDERYRSNIPVELMSI